MDSTTYFSVAHKFQVFLELWPQDLPLPTESQLNDLLPIGLQLMSDVKALEDKCLLQLRHLDDEASSIADYLKLQSRKIDLVLQHVLAQSPQAGEAVTGVRFGGGGLQLLTAAPLEVGSQYKLTLYLKEECIALLCFAKVTDNAPAASAPLLHVPHSDLTRINTDNPDTTSDTSSDDTIAQKQDEKPAHFLNELQFSVIQDADMEQLIKASLRIQQKQLQLKKLIQTQQPEQSN